MTSEFSKNQQSSIATIPTDVHFALFGIINKARMLNGWKTKTAIELDATIKAWAEVFSQYDIPTDAYQELYFRAFDTRQTKMRNGDDVPMMDATLIVSHWEGEYGVRAVIKTLAYEKLVKEGRSLGYEPNQNVLPVADGMAYLRQLLEKETE